MTKTLATQVASLALAVVATFGVVSGVSGAAAHQRSAVEGRAALLAMAEPGAVQHVTVIGHRNRRA
jgi:hypothetical protein